MFVQGTNGLANINYQCTAGETVRSFALDVSVDRGVILAVTNFFRASSAAPAVKASNESSQLPSEFYWRSSRYAREGFIKRGRFTLGGKN